MKQVTLFLIIITIALASFIYRADIGGVLNDSFFGVFKEQLKGVGDEVAKDIEVIREAGKEIIAPEPLRARIQTPNTVLTIAGTIAQTNKQRRDAGLPPLLENFQLRLAAEHKVKDMFVQQYFDHNSPQGVSVGDLAEGAGYEFIAVGENLALGNFGDDQALVRAWMDSPGHRANILHGRYTEIGVFVMEGIFEGETTWLAVQEFGKPLSSCFSPEELLLKQIEENEAKLLQMSWELEARKKELEQMRPKRGAEYNQKAQDYNTLVAEYNSLVEETKKMTARYNDQVRIFNECAAE